MANDQGHFLAYQNWVEERATVLATTTDDQGNRVVANLKTRESDDVWRFPVAVDAVTATVTVTFDADKTIGVVTSGFPRDEYPGISEANPSFGATDTIRYRLLDASDVQLADSGTNASGVVPGYMSHFWKPGAAVTGVRKLEATYAATSRIAAGFCDVGTIGAWPIIEPNVGFAYPAGFGWRHNTENQRTPTGRVYSAGFDPSRRWSLELDFLTNDESMIIDEMLRYSRGARQVFIRRGDLPTGKDAMFALVSTTRDMESRTATHRRQVFTFDEFI
jgi:hypothetical protein